MRVWKNLTFQVLMAIGLGIILGLTLPSLAVQMKPLGDLFINLIKMVIGPVVFLTIVLGIATMTNMKKAGRLGGKALIYFEIVTTLALFIGLFVGNIVKPGVGIDTSKATDIDVSQYTKAGKEMDWGEYFLHMVPDSFVGAFVEGDVLQIVFLSILFGLGLLMIGDEKKPVIELLQKVSDVFFKIVKIIMYLSPLAAFGAMSFTIGKFGLSTLLPLAKMVITVYMTLFLFIFVVLGLICRYYQIPLWRFIQYIKDEIFIVLGTASSETALPQLMKKLEDFGCSKSVVGLVVPTGYSFNHDGICIYLSMAIIFISQAFQVPLSWQDQLMMILILMITSKGAAGIVGASFVILASTISTTQIVPLAGLGLLLGIDRILSEARSITNVIGNGVAAMVIAKSENEFDVEKMNQVIQTLTKRKVTKATTISEEAR